MYQKTLLSSNPGGESAEVFLMHCVQFIAAHLQRCCTILKRNELFTVQVVKGLLADFFFVLQIQPYLNML